MDGRYTIQRLRSLFLTDERYGDTLKRIQGTDLLIIDELSMLSRKYLDLIKGVCRLRNADLPFSGIQIVLGGIFTSCHQ